MEDGKCDSLLSSILDLPSSVSAMPGRSRSAKYRVLLTDRAWPDADLEREVLGSAGAELIEAPDGAESTLTGLARDADAILTCWAAVTGEVIRASPRLRIVARLGIGLDNIDVAA